MKMREKEINLFLFYYSVLLLNLYYLSLCERLDHFFLQVHKIRNKWLRYLLKIRFAAMNKPDRRWLQRFKVIRFIPEKEQTAGIVASYQIAFPIDRRFSEPRCDQTETNLKNMAHGFSSERTHLAINERILPENDLFQVISRIL